MEHIIDAKDKALGRVASAAALLLRGKDEPTFRPHLLPETSVKIINAGAMKISNKKLTDKIYLRYTGYPGGQRAETLNDVLTKKGPDEAIRRAVRGMLPPNRLRAIMLTRLKIEN